MSTADLVAFDIECYRNYTLFMFKRFSDGKVLSFEKFNDSTISINSIKNILRKYTIVTFNGIKYDRLIVLATLAGYTNKNIHDVSNFIIQQQQQPWQVMKQFGLVDFPYDEIDLIEVAPLSASLKVYAGRLNVPKMQDLPIEPMARIKSTDLPEMRAYCENDLDDTIALYNSLHRDIKLREKMSSEYHVDLRSKSDAQIAEVVIKHEMQEKYDITPKKVKVRANTQYIFKSPDAICFKTPELNNLHHDFCNHPLTVGTSGHLQLPEKLSSLTVMANGKTKLLRVALDELIAAWATDEEIISAIESSSCKNVKSILRRCNTARKKGSPMVIPKKENHRIVKVGGSVYKIGMGGLHSMEESTAHETDDDTLLIEYDVASYYPAIILVNEYAPKALGLPFLKIYESIVTRRLAAKANAKNIRKQIAKLKGELKNVRITD